MKTRQRSQKWYRRLQQRGFTLIETLVIVMVIGILAAVSAPSFGSLLDSIKVNQSVTDLKTALQDSQRQAIRKNQVCSAQLPNVGKGNSGEGSGKGSKKKQMVEGNCLTSGSPDQPDSVTLVSNLKSVVSSLPTGTSDRVVEVKFGAQGSAEFAVLTSVVAPAIPKDPSGKVIAYVADKPQIQKKCVAISSTLGLTRIGTYSGSIDPASITDQGVCTALDWKYQ
ncbi:MAG TPA: type II secretion system protein [Stenomitos sp.]